jgi:hypothetical protein
MSRVEPIVLAWAVTVSCLALNAASQQDRSAPAVQALPAVPLSAVQTPGGDFTVALPPGWTAKSSAEGDSMAMNPAGKTQPSIYLAVLAVSDLRYQANLAGCTGGFHAFGNVLTQCVIPSVRIQLRDSSRTWSAEEAVQMILQRLHEANRGGQGFGAPALIPSSRSQVFYRVTSTGPTGPLENWGVVTIAALPNPMLGPGEVTSLAWVAGCSAPRSGAGSFRRTCAGVLHSLQPNAAWSGRLARRMAATYEQEAQILIRIGQTVLPGFRARGQMIAGFGQSMQQMQLQTFHALEAREYRTGQDWVATFGGNTNVRDPATGKYYTVPYGYRSYCLDGRGSTPMVLMGPDEAPGKSIGRAVCQRRLVP